MLEGKKEFLSLRFESMQALLFLFISPGLVLHLLPFIQILVIPLLKPRAGYGFCLQLVKQETPPQPQCWLFPAAGKEGRSGELGSMEDTPDALGT